MSAPVDVILNQIDALLPLYEELVPKAKYSDLSDLPEEDIQHIRVRYLAAVERLAPAGSAYRAAAERISESHHPGPAIRSLHGTLLALRADFEAGYLQTIEEIVHASVFADFLEMADELLGKSYKDPAAVITGSVLEGHLRKLAERSGIALEHRGRPRKADSLNADLTKQVVYNALEQKSVTAWLDLRNKAAHGHYDAYDAAHVRLMLEGVRAFLTRHPA